MKPIVFNYGIRVIAVLVLSLALVCPSLAADEPSPDPSGSSSGGIADIVGASAGAPTADEIKALAAAEPLAAKVGDAVGKNRVAINTVWTLVCGFLVMFMQAGFALAETGFTRAKNAGHTMAMDFMVYVLGMLGYWLCGFALQMGGAGSFATFGGGGVRICAWCKKLLDRQNNTEDVPFDISAEISHGCCNACKEVIEKELQEYRILLQKKKDSVIIRS